MAKKKIELQPGDIFSFPINATEFAYGRILIDVYNQGLKKGLLDKFSALYFTNNTVFVEIYKEITTDRDLVPENLSVLIPGIYTANGFLKAGLWKIHGNEEVDPTTLDFPEFLTHDGAFKSTFTRGELRVEIPLPSEKTAAIKVFNKQTAGVLFGSIVLYQLGRKSEINYPNVEDVDFFHIGKRDLRFSEYRDEILALVPDEYKGPYYETSKALGFDLKRLF